MERIMQIGLISVFVLGMGFSLKAQLPRFAQYRAYRSLINPAALESQYLQYDRYYNLTTHLSYRNEGAFTRQDAPSTRLAKVNWIPEIGNQFRLLLGGFVFTDQFGPTQFTSAGFRIGSFSYNSDLGNLSIGFNLGLNQYRLKLTADQFQSTADIVLNNNVQQSYLNLGAGIFYSKRAGKNDWYAGISVPRLFELDRTSLNEEGTFNRVFRPQWYGMLGAHLYTGQRSFLEPSILLLRQSEQDLFFEKEILQANFNLRYHMEEAPVWLGFGASTGELFLIEFGIDLNTFNKDIHAFRFGLGYTFNNGSVINATKHALELNLSLLLHTE